MSAPSDSYLQRFNERTAQQIFEAEIEQWLEREFGCERGCSQGDEDALRF